ncbi:ankyrin repeat domain-containing protein [Candidatus Dependentiae bacterium]|nr:ankyrin repeat domain-containing protein [Candidatus Dependentiae bacterium]
MKKYILAVTVFFILPLYSMHYLRSLAGYDSDYYYEQLLQAAAGQKDQEALRKVLRYANLNVINKPDAAGDTALHIAAHNNTKTAIELLVNHPGIAINSKNKAQETPLSCAVARCNIQAVKALLAVGAEINIKNALGFTALHTAIDEGSAAQKEIIPLLLQAGAYLTIRDKQDRTPATLAANVHRAPPTDVNIRKAINALIINHILTEIVPKKCKAWVKLLSTNRSKLDETSAVPLLNKDVLYIIAGYITKAEVAKKLKIDELTLYL